MLWRMVTAGIFDCLDNDASESQCAGNTCDKSTLQTKVFEQTLQPRRHNDSHNKAVTYAANSLTMFLTSFAQYLLMEPCELYPC